MAAPSDKNEIFLSSSPHYGSGLQTTHIMLAVIVSLLPLCVAGVIFFGVQALITLLVSIVSCVVFEFLFRKIIGRANRCGDCSAIVTGIMFALVLPPDAPIWMVMLGSLFSIVVAKEFFGGLGMNVFNPALSGRAFLFLSFPAVMGTWKIPAFKTYADIVSSASLAEEAADVLTGPTPLVNGMHGISYLDMFLGNRGGCIGETSAMLILVAFVFLVLVHVIDWRAPVAMVATAVLYEWLFTGSEGLCSGDPLFALMSGGLLFGAVFMTTDYATSPVTKKGRLLFGFGCGLITAIIRHFSGYPEGVMFSILIMNAFVSFLNRLTGRKYGFVLAKKGKAAK